MPDLESLTRDRGTIETLAYNFETMTVDGEPVDPPTDYELALTTLDTYPDEDDWHPAPWNAGPLERGDYLLRLRFTDDSEQPIRQLATITVL
jgi:hypothetical protein